IQKAVGGDVAEVDAAFAGILRRRQRRGGAVGSVDCCVFEGKSVDEKTSDAEILVGSIDGHPAQHDVLHIVQIDGNTVGGSVGARHVGDRSAAAIAAHRGVGAVASDCESAAGEVLQED